MRAAGICINDNKILLIWRKKEDREYWVFPGGSVEAGETEEEAVIRELQEETSINVTVEKLVYHFIHRDKMHKDWNDEQKFYLCSYISGEPHIQEDSQEAKKMKDGNNLYKPQWVFLNELKDLSLYPVEIRDSLVVDLKSKVFG